MLYGINPSASYAIAKVIHQALKNNNWPFPEQDKIILAQNNLHNPWKISKYDTLSNLNQRGYNTLMLPINELQQFKTIKAISNYIYQKAIQKHYDSEVISAVYHNKFEFEVHQPKSDKFPDLIKVWKLKKNNVDQSRYLITTSIPKLTEKLMEVKRQVESQYDPNVVFDIDLLIDNNDIEMILAPNGYEKYFTNPNDLSNYCLMFTE